MEIMHGINLMYIIALICSPWFNNRVRVKIVLSFLRRISYFESVNITAKDEYKPDLYAKPSVIGFQFWFLLASSQLLPFRWSARTREEQLMTSGLHVLAPAHPHAVQPNLVAHVLYHACAPDRRIQPVCVQAGAIAVVPHLDDCLQ